MTVAEDPSARQLIVVPVCSGVRAPRLGRVPEAERLAGAPQVAGLVGRPPRKAAARRGRSPPPRTSRAVMSVACRSWWQPLVTWPGTRAGRRPHIGMCGRLRWSRRCPGRTQDRFWLSPRTWCAERSPHDPVLGRLGAEGGCCQRLVHVLDVGARDEGQAAGADVEAEAAAAVAPLVGLFGGDGSHGAVAVGEDPDGVSAATDLAVEAGRSRRVCR